MIKVRINKNKGFTIVETLVAVAILMISIAGPLVVANQSLKAAQYAKNQSIATFLAQETIEYIKNIKNNNSTNGVGLANWLLTPNTVLNDSGVQVDLGAMCKSSIMSQGVSNLCDLDSKESVTGSLHTNCINTSSNPPKQGCVIYKDSNNNYSSNPASGNATGFRRFFNVDLQTSGTEARVKVTVSWIENGSVYNSVILPVTIVQNTR
jgi:type II secretory pathway pseudopilin PulG